MSVETRHTFSLSGLGEAPFNIVPPSDPKALENTAFFCEHCGTGLKNRYFVKSSDGKVSVVGIDCLSKTGDSGLIAGAKRVKADLRSQKKEAERGRALSQREAKERDALQGSTIEELLERAAKRYEQTEAQYIDKCRDLLFEHSTAVPGVFFGIFQSAINKGSFSDRMRATSLDVLAKSLSKGARKNSKAYKEAVIQAEEIFAKVADLALEGAGLMQSFWDFRLCVPHRWEQGKIAESDFENIRNEASKLSL